MPHVKYWLLQSSSELCLVQSLFHTPEKFWACAWTCENSSENNSHIILYCHAEFGTLMLKGIIMLGSCKGIQDLLEHENGPIQGSQRFVSLCFALKCLRYNILFCKLLWSVLHLFTFSTIIYHIIYFRGSVQECKSIWIWKMVTLIQSVQNNYNIWYINYLT